MTHKHRLRVNITLIQVKGCMTLELYRDGCKNSTLFSILDKEGPLASNPMKAPAANNTIYQREGPVRLSQEAQCRPFLVEMSFYPHGNSTLPS